MAKSQVRLKADVFLKNLKKEQQAYHMEIMQGFTENMDAIRARAANLMIIPRKGIAPGTKIDGRRSQSLYLLYKNQPTNPTKLTERTSFLKKILNSVGTWSKSLKAMRLKANPHLMFWVQPQQVGKRISYVGRMSVMERGDDQVKYRIGHETGRTKRNMKRRPFLEPAVMAEKTAVVEKLGKAVRKLRKI